MSVFGNLFGGLLGGGSAAAGAPKPSFFRGISDRVKDATMDGIATVPGQVIGAHVGGKLAGRAHKGYMDAAYPGTSAFERLGGSPGNGAQAGMSENVRIAAMNNRTQLKTAGVQAATERYKADKF